ncbi:hypothetical protein HDU97_003141 [Phlyctochytrium planicorne]|nr:hypothetical protein HDU97_003141 [Phlyctochytrium planicorne]
MLLQQQLLTAAAFLLSTSYIANAQKSPNDPCAKFNDGTPNSTYQLAPVAYACMNQVTYSVLGTPERNYINDHIVQLKSQYELYPFLQMAKNTGGDLYTSKVDFFAELDTIASTAKTVFEFHSRILFLIKSLQDAHSAYVPKCFVGEFVFYQPFSLSSYFPDVTKEPIIRITGSTYTKRDFGFFNASLWSSSLKDRSIESYLNYTVVSIDGKPAIQYVQEFADKYSGFSKEPDSRFNYVLEQNLFLDGKFERIPSPITKLVFLGHNASLERSYVLESPSKNETLNLTVPWIAHSVSSTYNLDAYISQNCRGTSRRPNGAASSKFSAQSMNPNDILSTMERAGGSQNLYTQFPELDPEAFAQAVSENKAEAARFVKGHIEPLKALHANSKALGQKAISVSLDKPVKSDAFNSFHILEDGITGVWVFSTFFPLSLQTSSIRQLTNDWARNVTLGITALQSMGAKKLIIDLSMNGGGFLCGSTAFSAFIKPDTDTLMMDARLTKAAKALFKTELYVGIKGYNTNDIVGTSRTLTRGGVADTYSAHFTIDCGNFKFALPPNPFPVENMALLTDGGCGSACAAFVRSLRDTWGVRSYVYGGTSRKPFNPVSFDGGVVFDWGSLQDPRVINKYRLSYEDQDALPKLFTVPIVGANIINEAYSPNGRGDLDTPAEWIPSPADGYVAVNDPNDKVSVWTETGKLLTAAAATPLVSNKKQRSSGGSGGLSTAAIAGIAVGAVALIATVLAAYLYRDKIFEKKEMPKPENLVVQQIVVVPPPQASQQLTEEQRLQTYLQAGTVAGHSVERPRSISPHLRSPSPAALGISK